MWQRALFPHSPLGLVARLASTGGAHALLLGALVQLARADDPVLGLVLVAVERHRTVAQPAK